MRATSVLRRTTAVAASLALLATLSACGGASGGASEESAADALPSAGQELSGDLTVWTGFTQGARAEWFQKQADAFMKEHPKVKIKLEAFAWGELNTKWTTGLAAGQVPDIAAALPNQVVEMINSEALIPVNDVIDDIGRDRFNAPALKEGEKDGKNYSIPLYSHAQVMWYRKDILAQHGLEVPTTWDELAAAAKKIGKSADLYGLSVPMGTNDLLATRYLNFYMRSKGETLLKKDGRANLTSDVAKEGTKYWTDLYKEVSPEGSVNYPVLDQATLFYQGKTAFDFNSGFHISGVEKARPDLLDQIAAAPLPRASASDPATYPAEVSNIATVVWDASKVKPLAKAFLRTLYNDDAYIEFLHSVPGGMLPVLKDINENPKYLDNPTIKKFADSIKVIEDQVALGSAMGMEEGPTVQSGILTSQGIIERMFQSVVLENKDIADATMAAEEELNKQFEAAGAKFSG